MGYLERLKKYLETSDDEFLPAFVLFIAIGVIFIIIALISLLF
jgi:hypothetical protein